MSLYDTTVKYRSGCGGLCFIVGGGIAGAAIGAACFGEGFYKIGTGAAGLFAGEAATLSVLGIYIHLRDYLNDKRKRENERDVNDCT